MGDEISEEQYAADLKSKQGSVKSLLTGHDKKGALEAVLRKPPLGSKEQGVKDATTELVASVLNQITESEIESVLAPLDNDMLDKIYDLCQLFVSIKHGDIECSATVVDLIIAGDENSIRVSLQSWPAGHPYESKKAEYDAFVDLLSTRLGLASISCKCPTAPACLPARLPRACAPHPTFSDA